MNIYQGTDRDVYVGELWTVKVARSDPGEFIKYAQYLRRTFGPDIVTDSWNSGDADTHQGLKGFLFHGIAANLRESRLAREYSDVVIPTLTLPNSFVNIQPTVPPTGFRHREIHFTFLDILGSKDIQTISHTLENTTNFGVHDGRIKLVDGGSEGLERLLIQRPGCIEQGLGELTVRH